MLKDDCLILNIQSSAPPVDFNEIGFEVDRFYVVED